MRQFIPACSCGSGKAAAARFDARGIFLQYACETCWPQKRVTYRPEIFYDPNYHTDEPIDSD